MTEREFEALVNDYSEQVLNTAMRILGDGQKAQDVHQEVFMAILRRWQSYNGQTKWKGYLYRTTVRKAIEFAKRNRAQPATGQQIEDVCGNERPEGQMQRDELYQRLIEQLAKLPKRQADVFVLARIERLKAEKIAEILGCSVQTVRVHLHRALRRLADNLSDYLKQ